MNKIFNKIKYLQKLPLRQRGAVLMVMLVILVTGGTAMLVSSLNSVTPRLARDNATASALAQAKEGLIGRAVSDATHPGSLPCPDTGTDGVAESTVGQPGNICPDSKYIGRLPWKTLGLPDLRDEAGERLWYALSPNFRDFTTNTINSNTVGTLQVYDNSGNTLLFPNGSSTAVAIIFAPGAIVGTQQRDAANQLLPGNYLETGPNSKNNAVGPFIVANKTSTFNDRLMVITTRDIISIVEKRVNKTLTDAFTTYTTANSGKFPYPSNLTGDSSSNPCAGKLPIASLTSLPAWFTDNNWADVVYYAASTSTLPLIGGGGGGGGGGMGGMGSPSTGTGCFNLLTVSGTSVNALFILPGMQLNSTTRASLSSANLADYFEDNMNKVIDANYVIPSSSSNDTLHILLP